MKRFSKTLSTLFLLGCLAVGSATMFQTQEAEALGLMCRFAKGQPNQCEDGGDGCRARYSCPDRN